MQSSSLKLFSSFEQKAMLLKRQAFAVFSGELDQYHLYLPLIQGRSPSQTVCISHGDMALLGISWRTKMSQLWGLEGPDVHVTRGV